MPWRTIDGTDLYRELGNERQTDGTVQEGLKTLLFGLFDKNRILDYILNFITFKHDGDDTSTITKKAAAYHQYHAVNKAVECTLSACGIDAPRGLIYGRFLEAEKGDPFQAREPAPRYGTGHHILITGGSVSSGTHRGLESFQWFSMPAKLSVIHIWKILPLLW